MDIEKLFEQAKNYLNFTWQDEAKEKKIREYLLSSMAYLNDVAGTELDFINNYLANDLLMNRVLYMDSQALPDFNNNYSGMLKELIIYAKCTKDTETI